MMSLAEGSEEVFVLSWPLGAPQEDAVHALAMVVLKRAGGAILAVPMGVFPMDAIMEGASAMEDAELGPGTVLSIPGVREEDKQLHLLGSDLEVLVIDVNETVVNSLVPLADSGLDPADAMAYGDDPSYFPDAATLLKFTKEWIEVSSSQVAQFYSAEEGPAVEAAVPLKARAKTKAKGGEKAKAYVTSYEDRGSYPEPCSPASFNGFPTQCNPGGAEEDAECYGHDSHVSASKGRSERCYYAGPGLCKDDGSATQDEVRDVCHPEASSSTSSWFTGPRLKPHGSGAGRGRGTGRGCTAGADGSAGPTCAAMLEQSKALTSLVSHLQSGGDPLIDGQGYASGTSSRGA